ncbi:unnamed protein product [Bursaphelenchus xylophilus]|nr:unnamed protein product [Bursaphelenchus xylophilus]CAG9117840.1 unnamed protein product [Bursaphelenchus xylophilus]
MMTLLRIAAIFVACVGCGVEAQPLPRFNVGSWWEYLPFSYDRGYKLQLDITKTSTYVIEDKCANIKPRPAYLKFVPEKSTTFKRLDRSFEETYETDLNEFRSVVQGYVGQDATGSDKKVRSFGVAKRVSKQRDPTMTNNNLLVGGVVGLARNTQANNPLYNGDIVFKNEKKILCNMARCYNQPSNVSICVHYRSFNGKLPARSKVISTVEAKPQTPLWKFEVDSFSFAETTINIPFNAILANTNPNIVLPSAVFSDILGNLEAKKVGDLYVVDCAYYDDGPTLDFKIGGEKVSVTSDIYIAHNAYNNETECILRIRPSTENQDDWVLGTAFLDLIGICLDFVNDKISFLEYV